MKIEIEISTEQKDYIIQTLKNNIIDLKMYIKDIEHEIESKMEIIQKIEQNN